VDVVDTFLEVDQLPGPGESEGVTLRVDGQLQHFYFRRGKNPADTLAASPAAGIYYLVEWRDFGMGSSKATTAGERPAVEESTWGRIKSFFRPAPP
jgi:hypothetical protein